MDKNKRIGKKLLNCLAMIILVIAGVVAAAKIWNIYTESRDKERAESNALSYIERKYGFTPVIVSSKRYIRHDYDFGLFISHTSKATDEYRVDMMYDDRAFSVFIPYTHETDEGRDDYQSDEICSAIEDGIASYFDGEVLAVDNYQDNKILSRYTVSEYYDGTNIDAFTGEYRDYYIYTTGADLADTELSKLSEDLGADNIYIFDCRSKEAFGELYEQDPFEILIPKIADISIDSCLPYLDEVLIGKGGPEKEYQKVRLGEYGGFIYSADKASDITISETLDLDPVKWDKDWIKEAVTESCSLSADGKLIIYYPKAAGADAGQKLTLLYTYIDKDGARIYKTSHDSSVSDSYYMFYISEEEINGLVFAMASY